MHLDRLLAVLFFDQVQRSGIGVGDAPALGEDQFKQAIEVVLGRQCRTDLIQLLDLPRNSPQTLVDLLANMDQMDVVERVVHRAL